MIKILFSCEHASNAVPPECAELMAPAARWLSTHRGYDLGAAPVARHLARALNSPLFEGKFTRLLVDLNRSSHNLEVFSKYTRKLDERGKKALLRRYHAPYWRGVASCVDRWLRAGHHVIHVGVHSFTPVLRGERRQTELAWLYHPGYELERRWVEASVAFWKRRSQVWRLRRNYPYTGISDGLATALRQSRPADRYAGVIFEINHRLLRTPVSRRRVAAHVEAMVRYSLERLEGGA